MIKKPKLLISSCLVGQNVRYDGKNSLIDDYEKLNEKYELFSFCPEIASGMVVPRLPSEIKGIAPLVVHNEFGIDVTDYFIDGAQQALNVCNTNNINIALLKSKSPSCGNIEIYDGTFSKKLIQGQGLTANILLNNNIKVYNENQIGELI